MKTHTKRCGRTVAQELRDEVAAFKRDREQQHRHWFALVGAPELRNRAKRGETFAHLRVPGDVAAKIARAARAAGLQVKVSVSPKMIPDRPFEETWIMFSWGEGEKEDQPAQRRTRRASEPR